MFSWLNVLALLPIAPTKTIRLHLSKLALGSDQIPLALNGTAR
jgi:hypothetical protein